MGILSDVTIPLDELIQPTEGLGSQMVRAVLQELSYDIAEVGFEMTVKSIAALIQE